MVLKGKIKKRRHAESTQNKTRHLKGLFRLSSLPTRAGQPPVWPTIVSAPGLAFPAFPLICTLTLFISWEWGILAEQGTNKAATGCWGNSSTCLTVTVLGLPGSPHRLPGRGTSLDGGGGQPECKWLGVEEREDQTPKLSTEQTPWGGGFPLTSQAAWDLGTPCCDMTDIGMAVCALSLTPVTTGTRCHKQLKWMVCWGTGAASHPCGHHGSPGTPLEKATWGELQSTLVLPTSKTQHTQPTT